MKVCVEILAVLSLGWGSRNRFAAAFLCQSAGRRLPHATSRPTTSCSATAESENTADAKIISPPEKLVLEKMLANAKAAKEWGDMFGLPEEAAFYSLFAALREGAQLGLKGKPLVLRKSDIKQSLDGVSESGVEDYFTIDDLETAVTDDFLDADRGSTDNRKGWTVRSVSTPRGNSFEEARMTFEEVQAALEKGTVIFNACGAHIPKLARATLACTDATSLPCAANLYVTASGKRTSAPPHTDRQDVLVVQTSGKKHWRVYSPPDPSLKPSADCYARGKWTDNLPLYALESEMGCELLLETTLNVGDVLFIPAAFPHTTDTVHPDCEDSEDTSIHLTFNFETHVWDLDYLSARRLALRRAGVPDSALGQINEDQNKYVGKVNILPSHVRDDLFEALPLGLLEDGDEAIDILDRSASELERISQAVDADTASAVPKDVWRETIERLRQQGMELFDIHRDMYLAAIEEGRTREAEDAMTAHLDNKPKTLSQERMRRLNVFRVPRFYDEVTESKQRLTEWSLAGKLADDSTSGGKSEALPENWAFTLPVKVGDQVEADLGGAFFPATVTKVLPGGSSFEVQFFDGDKESGLERSMLKLLKPPSNTAAANADTSGMTKKQLKRWKKEQEKLNQN